MAVGSRCSFSFSALNLRPSDEQSNSLVSVCGRPRSGALHSSLRSEPEEADCRLHY